MKPRYETDEGERGRWYDVPTTTTLTPDWTVLALDNGNRILSFGDIHAAGAQVHVLDPEGYEVMMWDCAEWSNSDGELVMGAFLRTAGGLVIKRD